MRSVKSFVVGLCMLVGVGTLSAPAHATWLGLGDGTYDVTLTCVLSTVIPCPSTINGTLTIAGSTATAFDFTVDGLSFAGAPTNGTATTGFGTDENAFVEIAPFAFLSLQHFLTGSFPGLTADSWGYCNNLDPTHCTPATLGNWTAVAVPEPPAAALVALGLFAVGAARRLRPRITR